MALFKINDNFKNVIYYMVFMIANEWFDLLGVVDKYKWSFYTRTKEGGLLWKKVETTKQG